MNVSGLQNVATREVLLFGGEVQAFPWGDSEVSAFVLVQDAAEDGRRVEFRPGDRSKRMSREVRTVSSPAHVVNSTVRCNQGTCPHVPDEPIVFDLRSLS